MSDRNSSIDSSQSNKKLEEGFILDNRYKISRVIGEGGFGITYDAVNIHSGKRVAVKENRHGDPQKFLQEARTLHDFEEESSVVNVLDYFEAEGTAYIVMEYLDGIPLALEIRQKGKWDTEKTVHSFIPVMKALEHMHQAGVIHRDISPDNLMVLPDGKLILMDFGAAKEIHKQNVTMTSIYKSVYSPPEQRESGITLGSYTDVYALCATIYFCITGQEPEDALSRLLFDELKKPSECGAEIKSGSEKALLDGLELDSANRTQDVAELRKQLENDYPDLTEEEREIRIKNAKKRKRLIFTLCGIFALIILGLIFKFRVNILFSTIDTQTIILDSSLMQPEDFRNNADIVKKRVEVFSDNKYLWKEDQGHILFEVPSELFHGIDPQKAVRFALTRPMVMSVIVSKDSDEEKNLGIFSQKKDISSVENNKDGLDVFFTNEAAKRFEGALDRDGTELTIVFDMDAAYSDYGAYTGFSNGDGSSLHIKSDDPEDKSDDHFWLPDELKKLHLTAMPSTAPFSVLAEWKVRWEDVNTTLFPGKNQVNPKDIPGPVISVKYVRSSLKTNEVKSSVYDISAIGFQAALKNRLDSLDFPYAVGIDIYNENTFVVMFPSKRYLYEEIAYLQKFNKYHLSFGSSKTNTLSHPDSISVITQDDGSWQMETVISKNDFEKLEEVFQILRQQGETEFYLYYYKIPLFVCPLDEAYNSFQESGTICFTGLLSSAYTDMNETTLNIGNFLMSCIEQSIPENASYNFDSLIQLRDENGHLVFSDADQYLPLPLTGDPEITDLLSEWKQKYEDSLGFSYFQDVDERFLRITSLTPDINTPGSALKTIESFLGEHENELGRSAFQSINFYILQGDSFENILSPGKPLVSITVRMDFEIGKHIFPDYFSLGVYNCENPDKLSKDYQVYFTASPVWQKFIRPGQEDIMP